MNARAIALAQSCASVDVAECNGPQHSNGGDRPSSERSALLCATPAYHNGLVTLLGYSPWVKPILVYPSLVTTVFVTGDP
jgi:hypothetical protein